MLDLMSFEICGLCVYLFDFSMILSVLAAPQAVDVVSGVVTVNRTFYDGI